MFLGTFYLFSLILANITFVRLSLNFGRRKNLFFIDFEPSYRTSLMTTELNHTKNHEIEGLARNEFPILNKDDPNLKNLIFFNNATTTQKPNCVLKTVFDYYTTHNFSVHRGSGTSHDHLSTEIYENARQKVADFINASSKTEVIFTSGTTHSISLVANNWASNNLKPDDVILVTLSEHASNLLPWRALCKRLGCKLEYVKLNKNGTFDYDHLEYLLRTKKPKLFCCGHSSNASGIVHDLKRAAKLAHQYGCYVLADAAQSAGKVKLDVQDMDVDFLAASGHKMYAPTGIGFLYYKKHLLEKVEPHDSGGGSVKDVSFDNVYYLDAPYKFESGTPPVAQAVGLGAAVDFINRVGLDKIETHDKQLLHYLYDKIKDLVNLHNFDPNLKRLPIISFNVDGIDPLDLCSMLATKNVLTRAGKHCAYLLHRSYFCTNTVRVSLGMYNNSREVDKFVEVLKECLTTLK